MKNHYPFYFLVAALLILTAGNAFSQKSSFKAVNDTVDLIPGIPVTIDLMANDTIPAGDTAYAHRRTYDQTAMAQR